MVRVPTLEGDGLSLHYERAGDGPPLLLLAGGGSDNASWAPVVAGLGAHFELVMPDNRGCGRTTPVEPFAFAALADDAVRLLDALGIARAHVVGHSMGAMVALDLASRFAARVGRVVFAASAAQPGSRAVAVLDALRRARAEGCSEETWLRLFHPWLFAPAFFDDPAANEAAVAAALAYPHRQTAAGAAAQVTAIAALDLGARVPAVTAPALVLCGDADILIPPEASRASFASLAHARFETIAGAGHALHWDRPEAFVAAVTRFLAEADGGGADERG